jgi:hypothetical protein
MAKSAKTTVDVMDLGNGKFLLVGVLTREQLEATRDVFEPLSRSWRGQYQSMAKAIVEAYNNWMARNA